MSTYIKIVINKKLLSQPSRAVTRDEFDNGFVEKVISELKYTAKQFKTKNKRNISGLAAVQIGMLVSICIVRGRFGKWTTIINPTIKHKSNIKRLNYEKCLSFPNQAFSVERYDSIEVVYLDENFSIKECTFKGKIGRRVQHEIDHIRGVVPSAFQFKLGNKKLKET